MIKVALLSAILSFSIPLFADDIEIYSNTIPYDELGTGEIAPPNPNYPNILFVLDASLSMSFLDSGPKSRIQRLREAMDTVLNIAENVNVGLMRLSHLESGGRVIYPMSSIDYSRDDIKKTIQDMSLDWFTPTTGAILEAAYYYSGKPVHYGKVRAAKASEKHSAVHRTRVSHPESYTGGRVIREHLCTDEALNHISCASEEIVTDPVAGDPVYISPILNECQKNYMVVINDGASEKLDITKAEELTGRTCTVRDDNACGVEIAEYLATQDQAPDIPGINTVTTFTIGFNASIDALEKIADAGGGKYFESSSADELAATLTESVIQAAKEGNKSFVAPAITLDQFTRFSHRDDMYLALFEPAATQSWNGNLKKYRYDGGVKDKNDIFVLDDTSAIVPTAHSYWSEIPDGASITNGGAAHKLDADNRNVYTYLSGNSTDLTDLVNKLDETNPLITATMLNVPADEMINLLQWARGVDVKNEFPDSTTRPRMGDPLHSKPTVLTYGGTQTDPISLIFFGTNDGYLHAINSRDGTEQFAFVPEELLGNLIENYEDNTTNNRLYGMDGDITLQVNDVNNDGVISGTDTAYLYTGMRRGGRNYYALNVSNRTKPEFLWSIQGGAGDFVKLGQSWSKPTLTKISIGGAITDVLIFAGGYDSMQDATTIRSPDTVGNDLFIVHAKTGKLIWNTATSSDTDVYDKNMKYSIPSDPQVIDVNGDGLVDQIYIGDMGGQVWRFDINSQAGAANELVKGGVIAQLAGTSVADNRRFFYRPDIAMVRQDGKRFLSVAIGSGNRAHPLDTFVDNRFYMIRQESVFEAPAIYTTITEDDLYDATENLINSTYAEIAAKASESLAEKQGWLIQLNSVGEKVLASSLTVNHQVIFTTYLPDSSIVNCTHEPGSGRTYSVSVLDATPTTGTTAEERFVLLDNAGIPSDPTPIINGEGDLTVVVGLEEVPVPEFEDKARVYWYEPSNY